MFHIPVHDRGQIELPEVAELEPQRSAGELHVVGHLDYGPKRHTPQRYWIAPPECVHVDAVPMIRANHCQAGKSAFGRFGLTDNWQVTPAAEIEQVRHNHVLKLNNGSRNHFKSERFSRMMSAFRSIPAWSGMLLP